MDAYFRVGRKFTIKKRNKNGVDEEIKEPVILEYVTRDGLVQVEIEEGEVQKIITTQSKEIYDRERYNAEEFKGLSKKGSKSSLWGMTK